MTNKINISISLAAIHKSLDERSAKLSWEAPPRDGAQRDDAQRDDARRDGARRDGAQRDDAHRDRSRGREASRRGMSSSGWLSSFRGNLWGLRHLTSPALRGLSPIDLLMRECGFPASKAASKPLEGSSLEKSSQVQWSEVRTPSESRYSLEGLRQKIDFLNRESLCAQMSRDPVQVDDSASLLKGLNELLALQPSPALLEHARAHCQFEQLSLPLRLEIASVSRARREEAGTLALGGEFKVSLLCHSDLLALYLIIRDYQRQSGDPLFHAHLFDIRDQLLRRSEGSSSVARKISGLLDLTLLDVREGWIDQIRRMGNRPLGQRQARFHSLVKRSDAVGAARLENMRISRLTPTRASLLPRKLKVLKVALENSRNAVGGVSSVLKATSLAHKSLGRESIRGIHPLYTHDKGMFELKYMGIIHHEFKGQMVESTLYKDGEKGEYLIQPDPRYHAIFDVASSDKLYNSFQWSPQEDRWLYYASAASVFAATYCGKHADKGIDVLQGDGQMGGPVFEVMATRLDGLRKQVGLHEIKRIQLSHMLVETYLDSMRIPASDLAQIGADTRGYGYDIHFTCSSLMRSHINAFVSKGVVEDLLSDDPKLNKGLKREATPASKVVGITNGIDTQLYDICDAKSFGPYALTRTFLDEEGCCETSDYLSHRASIKRDLYDAGILADPDKPVLLYVGRLAGEKGIDVLAAILDEVKASGIQMVVMGLRVGPVEAVDAIEAAAKGEYSDCLRFYDRRSDQMDLFCHPEKGECSVKRGWLLRACSEWVINPSHIEACGLVAMEAQCTGAFVIAPLIQGLRDMCHPMEEEEESLQSQLDSDLDLDLEELDSESLESQSLDELDDSSSSSVISSVLGSRRSEVAISDASHRGNAFTYDKHDDYREARAALQRAIQWVASSTPDERNRRCAAIRNSAVSSYNWLHRDGDGEFSGAIVAYSDLYRSMVHAGQERSDVETGEQAKARATRQMVVGG